MKKKELKGSTPIVSEKKCASGNCKPSSLLQYMQEKAKEVKSQPAPVEKKKKK